MAARNFIVLDTETAPVCAFKNPNNPEPWNSRVYDAGWIISDRDGNTSVERSFIVKETFYNRDIMNSAYYANKLPQYWEGRGKDWKVASFYDVWQVFNDDVKSCGVRDVWAYNCKFDRQTLDATIRDYSRWFVRSFVPANVQWRDIWDYAGSTICNTWKYCNWAINNGFVTAKGNPSTNAETVYRYLTQDKQFAESHTALDDAKIEHYILCSVFKRHQKARQSCGQGWRDAAKLAKAC